MIKNRDIILLVIKQLDTSLKFSMINPKVLFIYMQYKPTVESLGIYDLFYIMIKEMKEGSRENIIADLFCIPIESFHASI